MSDTARGPFTISLPELSVDEIEVTPEMADAGCSAYYQVPRYRGDEAMNDEIAAIIYRAMRRLER